MSSTPRYRPRKSPTRTWTSCPVASAGAASVEVPLVGGVAGGVDADLLSGSVSGALGATVLGVAGLGSAATLSV